MVADGQMKPDRQVGGVELINGAGGKKRQMESSGRMKIETIAGVTRRPPMLESDRTQSVGVTRWVRQHLWWTWIGKTYRLEYPDLKHCLSMSFRDVA